MYRMNALFSVVVPLSMALATCLSLEGAEIVESKEHECANLVTKLSDLLLEGDRGTVASDPLKTTISSKLAQVYGLHVVKPNETLSSIARLYGITAPKLLRLNPEVKGAQPPLVIAQVLKIRESSEKRAVPPRSPNP